MSSASKKKGSTASTGGGGGGGRKPTKNGAPAAPSPVRRSGRGKPHITAHASARLRKGGRGASVNTEDDMEDDDVHERQHDQDNHNDGEDYSDLDNDM
jgi:hypothetical protein